MSNQNSHYEFDLCFRRVRRYTDGAALIFTNAGALYKEAELLGQAGHFARATVLHQISMEECSKIETLCAAATTILLGHDVDEPRLAKAFRNHKAKNHANAYFARITDEEMDARARGDRKAGIKAFKRFQDKFHTEVNNIKNAGLYVDFQDGQFTAPVDELDEPTAIAFQRANVYFLNHGESFLSLLRRMVSEPDYYAELTKTLGEQLEALRAAKELDPQQIFNAIMEFEYESLEQGGGRELEDLP